MRGSAHASVLSLPVLIGAWTLHLNKIYTSAEDRGFSRSHRRRRGVRDRQASEEKHPNSRRDPQFRGARQQPPGCRDAIQSCCQRLRCRLACAFDHLPSIFLDLCRSSGKHGTCDAQFVRPSQTSVLGLAATSVPLSTKQFSARATSRIRSRQPKASKG